MRQRNTAERFIVFWVTRRGERVRAYHENLEHGGGHAETSYKQGHLGWLTPNDEFGRKSYCWGFFFSARITRKGTK
jgi:hypothetical protein